MEETKQYLGQIKASESHEIEPVIERLAGLEELLLIAEDVALSDKIKNEMSELHQQSDKWWKTLIARYGWNVTPGTHWEVDYQENKVWIDQCS